ncbi:MAG TPA: GtrA family protein [Streptosporangiaceae bacterium]
MTVAAPWDEQDWDDRGWDQQTGRLVGSAPARPAAPPVRRPTWTPAPDPAPVQRPARPRPSWTPVPSQARPGPAWTPAPNPAPPGRARTPDPAAARGPRAAGSVVRARVWGQRTRLTIFGLNGTAVFAAGLMIQIILVQYLGMAHVPSYIVQTLVSIQLSFLLSRYLTWRDRSVSFGHGLIKFNAQQLAVTGLGMAGYAVLDWLGMNYVIANVLVTGLLTPVSFASSHLWSLRPRRTAPQVRH